MKACGPDLYTKFQTASLASACLPFECFRSMFKALRGTLIIHDLHNDSRKLGSARIDDQDLILSRKRKDAALYRTLLPKFLAIIWEMSL